MKDPRPAWQSWVLRFLGSLGGLLAIHAFLWLVSGQDPLLSAPGRAAAGLFLAAWLFLAGYGMLRLALSLEWAPLGVARTTLEEAVRMKAAAAFIVVLLAALSVLPFSLSTGAPLHYRLQTLLSFGLGLTGVLLSLLTIFMSCATLSGELYDKRIFSTLTKPVGRAAYLLGKWLGIVLLDLLLLAVAGAALVGATLLLARQASQDAEVEKLVWGEVLVARIFIRPQPLEPHAARAGRELEILLREQPGSVQELGEEALRKQYPEKAEALLKAQPERALELGKTVAAEQLLQQAQREWRTIGPHARETYLFRGLQEARTSCEFVQFRYKMMASPLPADGKLPLSIFINDRPAPRALKTGLFEVLRIPVEMISADGELRVTVHNEPPGEARSAFETTLTFPPDDGLEILYRAGGCAGNLVRVLLIQWLKLSFLAILGLAAATFLGFPVAALLGLAVFAVASASGFLLEALTYFGENARFDDWKGSTSIFRAAASAFTHLLSQFSRFSPESQAVDGRLVPWSEVLACAGWIGLVWSGVTGLLGWLIFRMRELGRVQV